MRTTSAAPTVWTRRLQLLTVMCSAVFTIGTTLQTFVIVDAEMLRHSMQLAGVSATDARTESTGFLVGFRVVGCVFIVGNAFGLLALHGSNWVFWLVVAVNAGQAAGVVAVPTEVFQASIDLYGPAGILPTVVTDGGALLLLVTLLGSLLVFRVPWARRRTELSRQK